LLLTTPAIERIAGVVHFTNQKQRMPLPFFSSEPHIRKATIAFLGMVFLYTFFSYHRWPSEIEGGDPLGYYMHLPSALLYHDIGDYKSSLLAAREHFHGIPDPNVTYTTAEPTPIGKYHIKYPIGEAVLLVPFFTAAHLYCKVTGAYPADGYSSPYQFLAGLAPIFYVLLACWFLFGIFRRCFSLQVSVITVLTLGLATNLFYFTAYNNLLAHAFLFFTVAWVLDRTVRFWDQPTWRNAALVGAAVGITTITRIQDGVVVLIPLLWGVYSWSTLKTRFAFVFQNLPVFWVMGAALLACIFPQALYYKFVSGNWLWYSYGSEVLDLHHPRMLDGLLNYRNGWLVYTPVMALAILGIFRLGKYVPQAILPILTILPLHLWIAYSWWCWYYINGFGARPMIDLYALMALPLAAFIETAWKATWSKAAVSIVLVLFAALNIFQTWQTEHGVIQTPFESRAHYWAVFGETTHSKRALVIKDVNEDQPTEPLIFVRKITGNDMEDSTSASFQRKIKHSGNFAIRMDNDEYATLIVTDHNSMQDARPGDWVRFSIWGYTASESKMTDIMSQANLVGILLGSKDEFLKYRQVPIANKIGNPEGSIYSAGDTDIWGEASYFVRLPDDFPKDGSIRVYVWNPGKEKIYVDDLSVELWKEPGEEK
jgi:hypothetical protein